MTNHTPKEGAMLPEVKTILYATDLGNNAGRVFRWAMGLAHKYGAKIVIVHALEPMSPYTKSLVDMYLTEGTSKGLEAEGKQRIIDEVRRRLERFCAQEVCTAPGGDDLVAAIVIEEGRPVEVILDEAKRRSADLIVMGSHGHGAMGEIFLGGTAHRVMQRANVPVLLVRMKEGHKAENP